jgi:hypothetical protein
MQREKEGEGLTYGEIQAEKVTADIYARNSSSMGRCGRGRIGATGKRKTKKA